LLRLRRARMGRWKEAVSRAQRARKKRYWRRMGWVERRFVGLVEGGVVEVKVVLVVDVKGGGGVRGRAGEEEGVAFSIRAQVR